jgi:threonylcarbamoyladenosine tRNA methylthiotransferase MtaB
VADEEGLHGSGFGEIPLEYADIESMDWKLWDKKGIVKVTVKGGVLYVLDGWHFNGVKEVVLTGINIGDYSYLQKGLCELVKEIDKIKGLKRIRLSSIDPNMVDDRLKDVILNGEKTCKSMHISLQSGSDKILKKMNRRYNRSDFLKLVSDLQSNETDFLFTTDVIVGFPGESDDDFEDTLDIIKKVDFSKVHVFPYSKREGTIAETFKDQISSDIIKKRKAILFRLLEKKDFDLKERFMGKQMRVLLEKRTDDGKFFQSHSDNFMIIKVENENFSSNEIIDVIVSNTKDGLIGKKI